MRLVTIGYEGWGFDLWFEALVAEGVRVVVDVRQLPLSRRPGWSKKAVAERLSERGLGYVHMRGLGAPAPLRHALRDGSMSFAEFTPQFQIVLGEHLDDLDALIALARQQQVALLCWEEDPARCHRSLVAEAIRDRVDEPVEIVNIRRIDER